MGRLIRVSIVLVDEVSGMAETLTTEHLAVPGPDDVAIRDVSELSVDELIDELRRRAEARTTEEID